MKLFVEDIAFGVMKTLLTSDQRELLEKADEQKIKTVDAIAGVSFDFAEAFLKQAKGRDGTGKRLK